MLSVLGSLGTYVDGPGPPLGPMLGVLGPLGTYVGGLAPLLGPMLAVLAALGTYVGGPGRPWAEKWPKPEREQDPGGARGRRVAQTLAGAGSRRGPTGSEGREGPDRSEAQSGFVLCV